MHLEQGGSVQKDEKPSTYKGCGKRRKRTWLVEIYLAMWKSRLFSGKLALLTRHLRPIRVVNRTLLIVQSWLPRLHLTDAGL